MRVILFRAAVTATAFLAAAAAAHAQGRPAAAPARSPAPVTRTAAAGLARTNRGRALPGQAGPAEPASLPAMGTPPRYRPSVERAERGLQRNAAVPGQHRHAPPAEFESVGGAVQAPQG